LAYLVCWGFEDTVGNLVIIGWILLDLLQD
jgi:hypothetical protein